MNLTDPCGRITPVLSIGPGSRRLTSCLAGLIALFVAAVAAAPASASFHLMKIREVHEGGSNADYVELQMYSTGENFVGGHYLVTYDGVGNPFVTYQFPTSAPNGQTQRTILIADQNPIGVTPDFTVPTNNLFPGPNGSVCYLNQLTPAPLGIDCVSIGVTAPPQGSPSPVGSPVLPVDGLLPGQSVIRSIAPGCPTLLEAADDTDNSATDFALGTPNPRNNSMTPTEHACGGGGGSNDTTPPNTILKKRPPNRTKDRTPTFRFKSSEAGSTFLCKLDRKRTRRCTSPFTTKRLTLGRHTLKVFAVDSSGNRDPSPAKDAFRVIRG